jgi:signal transduction histidine kinase
VRRPKRLTARIVLAFVAFGGVLSMLLAALVLGAFAYAERDQLEDLVASELEYLRRSGEPHAAVLETISLFQGAEPDIRRQLPADLAGLEPGMHRLKHPQRLVGVERADGQLRVVSLDFADMHAREHRLMIVLAIAVLVALYLSSWVGYWLSRAIAAPVRQLAESVTRRSADDADTLAPHYADDEIGALARAVDGYETRIRELLQRERQFTDRASHELRTPVTVIAGATELLLDDPDLAPAARARVERIRRATLDMAELVETFLLLARERGAEEAGDGKEEPASPLSGLVRRVLEQQRVWLAGKPVELVLEIEADPPCPRPQRLLAIVVANLVRNACQYTESGAVHVRLRADGLDVSDTGPGLSPQEGHDVAPGARYSAGSGLGLPLVRSLCERGGWSVQWSERPGGGTIASLRFAAGPASVDGSFTSR